MRPIKFRCFDKKEQQMFMVESMTWDYPLMVLSEMKIANGRSGGLYDSVGIFPNERMPGKINRFEMMQYTGLKDKNGTEIYEGDVFEVQGLRFEVTFSDIRAGYVPFADGDGCGCCSFEVFDSSEGEVIGNIYEHPYLLEDD